MSVVSACGEPDGALIAFVIFRLAAGGSSLGFSTAGSPLIVTFAALWMSLEPPVPPVKPTSTLGGSVTAVLRYLVPSTQTLTVPFSVSTFTWRVAVRSAGIVVEVASQCSSPAPELPSLMPAKLLDGLAEFL